MKRRIALLAMLLGVSVASAQDAASDLKDFRTVETAITAKVVKSAASEPAAQPGHLGVYLAANLQGKLVVEHVEPESPAALAGLKPGDLLQKAAGTALTTAEAFRNLLLSKGAGEGLKLEIVRQDKAQEIATTLAAPSRVSAAVEPPKGPGKGSFDMRGQRRWTKPVYRLAVIGIEYTDVKHNDKIKVKDWEESLFSRSIYTKKSVTGQSVYGSMNDYYHEISYGTFHVEGKFFPWVQVSKKREDYGQPGGNKTALLTEAFNRLLERDGKDVLKDFDGVFIMFAGSRVQGVQRGS